MVYLTFQFKTSCNNPNPFPTAQVILPISDTEYFPRNQPASCLKTLSYMTLKMKLILMTPYTHDVDNLIHQMLVSYAG